MKIVLDTNVLVSALLNAQGPPARVLDLILKGEVTICLDGRIIEEYHDVLSRAQWHFSPEHVRVILDYLSEKAIIVAASPLDIDLPDPDDLKFIEVALAEGVDAIITGNKRHFPKSACKKIQVLSPQEFLAGNK